jgi:hypothetical protein
MASDIGIRSTDRGATVGVCAMADAIGYTDSKALQVID